MSHDKNPALEQLRRAVALQRLQQRSGAAASSHPAPAIPRAPREADLPLAWAQQRLWFLDQMDHAAGAAYHLVIALRLRGPLDLAALRATLDRIVARHENLRTRFVMHDGAPVQVIAPADTGFQLAERDLRELDVPAQEIAIAEISVEEARAPFDLATGPLIRGRLLVLGEQDHLLLLTQHHIISDGWSTGVLVKEVSALYSAFIAGQPDPLPDLPIQYADYAAWQRQWLQGEALSKQLEFWRSHLHGAPALLELPTDRPRPAVQTYAGDRVDVCLSPELTAALRALAQRHGATLFMTLLAGWSLLLSRLSGQKDVVVGTPVANRQRAEVEPLIGFFVNTLALRVDLDADPTVAELLAQVKATTLDAYAHQDLPFEQVVEALAPERSLSYSPVFQAVLSLNNTRGGRHHDIRLPGLTVEPVALARDTAHFDLELLLNDDGGPVEGHLAYASDLFERATIERCARYFVAVLEGMVADETAQVGRLPLMDAAEQAALLARFNPPTQACASDTLPHRTFEARVRECPDAIAISFEQKTLSYGELNRRANRIAHGLLARGVRPDDRVGLCCTRGPAMLAGLLGILKAGAGYVPLDPAYPHDRLAYMLADSAPVAVLVEAQLGARLPLFDGLHAPVLALEADFADEADTDPVVPELAPHHLAYVIYTSGSTGQPKGVMIEHAQVARLFTATQAHFGFGPQDVWTLFHSFAFDFSVWEIWGPLLHGGRLVIVPELCARAPAEFLDLLVREGVTVLNQTPSAFRALIAAQAASAAAHRLRTIVFGGEALELHTLLPWIQRNDPERTQLVNMYGITEITVHATWRRLSAADIHATQGSVIGAVLPDLRLYILDAHGAPVPCGVTGEIHIGGAGVARGYLNRDELTAQRFLPDPFSADPRARMYKAGDLARWRADGEVEYIGRNDFQVKIRGFRIELGEVEARLAACEGVRDAVVIARQDGADKRLVGYVVADHGVALSPQALRAQLAQHLAEYMVPSAFVVLDALPLTPNGKLDRRALPAPDRSAVLVREYEAPVGEVELALAQAWQELLKLDRVGRFDHFFELGGHSLLVIGLIEKLRQRGLALDVRSVFAAPTLQALAARIDQGDGAPAPEVPANRITRDTPRITPELLPLVALDQAAIDGIVSKVPGGVGNVQDIYPLAPLQQGILFHHLLEGQGDTYLVRSVLAFDNRARMESFVGALQAVIDRHDILRTAVHWEGLPQPVQVVQRAAPLPLLIVEAGEGETALDALRRESDPRRVRLDLRRAPILAASAIEDNEAGEWLLAVLRHHLVCDHVTMELVLAEVHALLQGDGCDLATPQPYRNFIARTHAVPEAEHAAYFQAELGDVGEPTAPFGVLDVRDGGDQAREARLHLAPQLSRRIRETARRLGVTPAVLFHLGWAQVLARCTGREDVVFGTVLSGRLQGSEAADRVVGMFINTLPLRIRLAGVSVVDAVRNTHAALGGLLVHEQASLALAQRSSGVPSPLPLFTTLLNYRHSAAADGDMARQWDGLRMLASEERNNYPLTVSVEDWGQDFGLTALAVPAIDGDRLVRYLAQAMDALTTDTAHAVLGLDVLPAEERTQLLVDFNATAAVEPLPQLLAHALFEQHAHERPEAPALLWQGGVFSYGEINIAANRVAHRLLALGVKPDDRVALCLPRSPAMVVGLLGAMKAGAAWVPLDPALPPERLGFMLGDCAPIALLTTSALRGTVPGSEALATLVLDDGSLQDQPAHDPRVADLTPEHLAYVLYTSGSTGTPKGVMVEHRGLAHYLAHARVAYLDGVQGAVVATPLAFDATLTTLVAPWTAGLPVALLDEDSQAGLQQLLEHLAQPAPWLFKLTPAHLDALANLATGEARTTAHRLVVGGEQLTVRTVQRLRERLLPHARVINEYGPTETVVGCTTFTSDGREELAGSAVPIGKPIANARIYLLDARQQPVPIGVAGEVHIGGGGMARGYLNREALTAERFIADPFAADSPARMYRTGDLARWLADGTLEYLGRNDFQVKIRGFRIELGEIEAQLARCAGVREAAVLAREDVPGDKRLVAYVVAEPGQAPGIASMREQLARTLAEYMLPSAFVVLDALPLTTNGKLDRKALPAPDHGAVLTRQYEAPVGEVETTIAAIWQELLGIARVGRHDHFFELGGHSLMVIGLIDRLRQRGYRVDVRSAFSTPVLAMLAATIEQAQAAALPDIPANPITPDTARLTPGLLPLVALSQEAIDGIVARIPGGVGNIQDIYPLAPLQEGILFHHLLGGEGDAYLMRSVVAFDDRERMEAFVAALQAVIDRHDILRTAVHWEDLPTPVQVVQRHAPLPVEQLLRDPSQPALAQLLGATNPRRSRLDLRHAPLLAGHCVHDPDTGEWLLSLLRHHMVCDHVTMDLILTEVHALLHGQGDRLPPPLPYRTFIARTHAVPGSEHEAYFRAQLGDVDEPTAPFGVLDVRDDGGLVTEARVRFDDTLSLSIRETARRLGVTPAVLFHTAWAQVLARCTGREDVVFGTVLSGRLQGADAADRVVGMFINTLPVRIGVGQGSVAEAARATHARLGELLVHEQASLALAQRCSAVSPGMPLFTTLLNYRYRHEESDSEGSAAMAATWPGTRVLSSGETRNNYPLTMSVEDWGQALGLTALSAPGIDGQRMVRYLEAAMAQMAADDAQPLRDVDVLPADEREQVVESFNGKVTAFPHDRTIHALFEEQARQQPDAEAVRCEGASLSYAELNARANQVAHRLIALGVQPDDRVALCAERSLSMIVGLLGVLKAGAAYVPLDPSYPVDRLAHMLGDSRPQALLCQQALVQALPVALDVPVIGLEDGSLDEQPVSNPETAVTSRHLAYVIYTSGSTGTPKGVMVEHRSAVNFWQVMRGTTHAECAPRSRVALNAAFSFDMSLKGILQLLSGHCLVLIPQAIRASGPALLQFLEAEKIDALDSTPSQLEGLLAAGLLEPTGHRPTSVLLGGEAIGRTMWDKLKAAPLTHFHNMYGPTEATVDATIGSIRHSSGGPTIGKPIANARVYVLDEHRQPVPIGVPGELYLGGVGVARGYLFRPELTEERFVSDPFVADPNAKMYKTGDLARWRADGTLEYLGRNDFQVKLRGFRIELGEIEARLADCDGVREAVVIAREDIEGDKRLVAYLVAREGHELSIAELREQLTQSLAEYMVPSAFVVLDALPLNPNGKLDRKALPAPDQSAVLTREYEAPVGDVEQAIAEVWQELLNLERVGRHDHFFELGGHSLLVMQLMLRLRERFHVEVPLRTLFERPQLAALAEVVTSLQMQAFLGEDLAGMSDELDGLSDEELKDMLERESTDE